MQKLHKTARRRGAADLNEEKNADLVIAHNLWRNHRLLPPPSLVVNNFQALWELLLVFFALYTVFVIPMRIAFQSVGDVFFLGAEIFVDTCFWIDIGVNFRTARLNEQYELVFEPRQIARMYLRDGFYADVFGALPIDYLVLGGGSLSPFRALLQVNRLLRARRLIGQSLNRAARTGQAGANSRAWVRIFLDFRNLFFFAHWVACIWWAIGLLQIDCVDRVFDEAARRANTSAAAVAAAVAAVAAGNGTLLAPELLLAVELDGLPAYNILEDFSPTSPLVTFGTNGCGRGVPWVIRTETSNLTAAPFLQQYLSSLYLSISTIVRNPWIPPDTQYEKWYTALVVVIGTIIFALIIGDVNAMVRTYDESSAARRRQLANIRLFMTFHDLPPALQTKMLLHAEGAATRIEL